jgi:hypothetical protein
MSMVSLSYLVNTVQTDGLECLEEYNDQDPQESIREAHEYLDSYKPDMRSDRYADGRFLL